MRIRFHGRYKHYIFPVLISLCDPWTYWSTLQNYSHFSVSDPYLGSFNALSDQLRPCICHVYYYRSVLVCATMPRVMHTPCGSDFLRRKASVSFKGMTPVQMLIVGRVAQSV